jgi:hypothetical protein
VFREGGHGKVQVSSSLTHKPPSRLRTTPIPPSDGLLQTVLTPNFLEVASSEMHNNKSFTKKTRAGKVVKVIEKAAVLLHPL